MGKKASDIKSIFSEALLKSNARKRGAYLDKACRNDPDIRAEIESLLKVHDEAGDFMEGQVFETAVTQDSVTLETGPASRPDLHLLETAAEAPALPINTVIEGYQVLQEISKGGQAVVFRAIQESTKRIVALKVLQGYISTQAQFRFEREVDLVANLQHNNIVTIYDSGIAQGQYYYAMEYIEGKPLDKYVRTQDLSTRKIMELFDKVCSAVAYAHQRGVIHRDLKPDNILVDSKGEPRILDFGIAKLTESPEQAYDKVMTTSVGQLIGTLAFMSPEQASGKPDTVDVRTDVYSIGVILYKVLTGKFPYDVIGPMLDTLRNIQQAEPTRPSRIVRHINSEVEAILLKALDKDPHRRYQSAAELHGDIENWLQGMPIIARSDSSIYLFRKIITRHYYASAVVALLLIIVLGFSASFFVILSNNVELKNDFNQVRQTLEDTEEKVAVLAQAVAFKYFLQGWQVDLVSDAIGYFSQDSREMQAAFFLLDKRPLAEKEPDFRKKLQSTEPAFTEFVIAEHYFKNKDHARAVVAYRQLLQKGDFTNDDWIKREIAVRLRELEIFDKQENDTDKN